MMQRQLLPDEIVDSIRFVLPGTVTIRRADHPAGPTAREGRIEVTIRTDGTGQRVTAKVLTVTP